MLSLNILVYGLPLPRLFNALLDRQYSLTFLVFFQHITMCHEALLQTHIGLLFLDYIQNGFQQKNDLGFYFFQMLHEWYNVQYWV